MLPLCIFVCYCIKFGVSVKCSDEKRTRPTRDQSIKRCNYHVSDVHMQSLITTIRLNAFEKKFDPSGDRLQVRNKSLCTFINCILPLFASNADGRTLFTRDNVRICAAACTQTNWLNDWSVSRQLREHCMRHKREPRKCHAPRKYGGSVLLYELLFKKKVVYFL